MYPLDVCMCICIFCACVRACVCIVLYDIVIVYWVFVCCGVVWCIALYCIVIRGVVVCIFGCACVCLGVRARV